MSGSMFDLSVTTFSNEGRIFQVEYATKAVENGETILGVKCKDGVILGAEKLVVSKLMVPGSNKRLYNIDKEIGCAINGKLPDGRHLVNRARSETSDYKNYYAIQMPGQVLADRLGQYVHQYTLYGSYRPLGSSCIVASHDNNGFHLNLIEPSGLAYGYNACVTGKGRQTVKTEFEKRDFKSLTCREALFYVAKMLHLCHEELKDKTFELEMSWVCEENNYVCQSVPHNLVAQAEAQAKIEIEKEAMGE